MYLRLKSWTLMGWKYLNCFKAWKSQPPPFSPVLLTQMADSSCKIKLSLLVEVDDISCVIIVFLKYDTGFSLWNLECESATWTKQVNVTTLNCLEDIYFIFLFLQPHRKLWNMEVPGPGIKLELQEFPSWRSG